MQQIVTSPLLGISGALEYAAGTRVVIVTTDLISISRVLPEQGTQAVAEKFELSESPLATDYFDLPHPNGPVETGRRESAAIWRESQAVN